MKKDMIKILITDDHQLIVEALKSLLSDVNNMTIVAEANNGKEAIGIIGKTSVDIVLMDVEMPVMNGWDATEIITSRYPETKVIALTTFSEKAIVKKMIDAGASGYVLKNVKKEILIEAIETVYKGETFFSSEIPLVLLKPSSEIAGNPKKQASSVHLLSSRETEILKLITQGLSNNEIATKLFISPKTVNAHRENIMKKLDVHNVIGLVRYALDNGLIE